MQREERRGGESEAEAETETCEGTRQGGTEKAEREQERCSRAAVGGLQNARWWFGAAAMCVHTQVAVRASASIIFISLRHYLDYHAEGGRWGNPVFFSPPPPQLYLFSALSVSTSRSESHTQLTSRRVVVVAGRVFFLLSAPPGLTRAIQSESRRCKENIRASSGCWQ